MKHIYHFTSCLTANAFSLLSRKCLPLLLGLVLRLDTHNTTAPSLPDFLEPVIEVGRAALNDLRKLGLILGTHGSEAKSSGVLLVHHSSETRAALDDAVRDLHLAAERREPNNKLDRIDIMSNDNKAGLLLLNKLGDVVDTKLQADRLFGRGRIAASLLSLGHNGEALLLLDGGLRLILTHELEQGARGGRIHGETELVYGRGHLETDEKDLALPLQTHVLGPLDVAAEVHVRGQHILANAKVLRPLLEERVLHFLLHRLLHGLRRGRGGATLSGFGLSLRSSERWAQFAFESRKRIATQHHKGKITVSRREKTKRIANSFAVCTGYG